jgi:uncharacterized membrane protein
LLPHFLGVFGAFLAYILLDLLDRWVSFFKPIFLDHLHLDVLDDELAQVLEEGRDVEGRLGGHLQVRHRVLVQHRLDLAIQLALTTLLIYFVAHQNLLRNEAAVLALLLAVIAQVPDDLANCRERLV